LESTGVIIMAVKSWQLGYDATTGNFVELDDIAAADPNDPRRVAFENQITAIMEQKGLLASQAQQYIANAYAQGTTLDALKHTSVQTGTAEERGDVWGASGIDKGKSYLERFNLKEDDPNFLKVEASTNRNENEALITKLYTEGFGREPDAAGLKYWTDELSKTDGMSYAKIAESFGVSEEAGIRNVYHQEYGRDADDAGLMYWMAHDDGKAAAEATIKDAGTLETQLRQEYADKLGQFSNETDRQANIAAGGFWTDVQEGGYADLDWTDFKEGTITGETNAEKIASAKASVSTDVQQAANYTGLAKFQDAILNPGTVTSSYTGGQIQTLDDVRDILGRREDIMNTTSTYDKDDAEGGSGIGRIFTLEEMDPWLHQSTDLNDLATKLGAEKWALLTKELMKVPGPDGPIKGPVMFDPGANPDVRDTNRNTLSNNYQVPVPPDYQSPDLANVSRTEVDYMPDLDGTVPNRPLRKLDSSYTTAPQQAVRKQGAFVAGTSAQGVRRRQSSAARSGRSAMGTKQLARNNMQIKSLNI